MKKYTHLSGSSLLGNAFFNKGTAFSEIERNEFNLHGLLPFKIETLEEQIKRVDSQLNAFENDKNKYVFLRNLQDTNETLFYKYITSHISETLPLIYTPTVGYACQHYSELWRKNRGVFVTWEDRDNLDKILRNTPSDNIKVIVVTDGERILGLGDLGIGGMGIPVGKLSLYSACGGIDPQICLPIILDVGTNNEELLNNPLYMGAHHKRISEHEYGLFVEMFVRAIQRRWPEVLLQFEDFALKNATPLLHKYQDQLCCFNDDIQGTAAVTLGTIQAACLSKGQQLSDQTIMFVGAGSAGCGIADLIISAMILEGMSREEASQRIFMIDKDGLLLAENKDIADFQRAFAWSRENLKFNVDNHDIDSLIGNIKPTVLIGVSGVQGLFTEEAIKKMHSYCNTPIILPLSNPTSRAEAVPEDLIKWTNGNAMVATGSPFEPVHYENRIIEIAQCNNAYIFPGMGLGVLISGAKRVTQNMFLSASKELASLASAEGRLLPDINDIRKVSKAISIAVATTAIADKVASPQLTHDLEAKTETLFWEPEYCDYQKISL